MQCAVGVGLSAARSLFLPRLKTSRFIHLRSMSQSKLPVTLLGSMAFGGRADAHLSAQLVQVFLERGHGELDTAFMYNDGQAETIIGNMQLPKTGKTSDSDHHRNEWVDHMTLHVACLFVSSKNMPCIH